MVDHPILSSIKSRLAEEKPAAFVDTKTNAYVCLIEMLTLDRELYERCLDGNFGYGFSQIANRAIQYDSLPDARTDLERVVKALEEAIETLQIIDGMKEGFEEDNYRAIQMAFDSLADIDKLLEGVE